MAYKIDNEDELIVVGDGPVTENEVRKIFKQTNTPEFYELEAAEVIECLLDDSDLPLIPNSSPPTRDYSTYGHVRCRMVVSNKGSQDIIQAAPLDADIKIYPYPGEYVIVAKYLGEFFYTQKINLKNRTDTNELSGLSKVQHAFQIESYKKNLPRIENSKIRMLDAEEGDISLEGRFGNTIRLGSNVKSTITDDGGVDDTTGKANSPNVIIRAGQGVDEQIHLKPVKEDINLDGSSLWMTTDQTVDFSSHYKSKVGDLDPKVFEGKQILINSDRIVFNSRQDTYLYSSRDINLVSKNRVVIEGHEKVFLGDAPKQGEDVGWTSFKNPSIQPVLKGDQTMDIIKSLIGYLEQFAGDLSPAKGGGNWGMPVPLTDVITSCLNLKGSLTELKTRLNEPKSDVVYVGDKR